MTNVVAALWSAEALHRIRFHRASFAAVCPDGIAAFASWWIGDLTLQPGLTSCLVLLDPISRGRSDRQRFVGMANIDSVRGRYAGYADAAAALNEFRRLSPGGAPGS